MKLIHALTLFFTLGLALVRDFFAEMGFVADLPTIGALGLAVTTLLIFRGIIPLLSIAALLVIIRVPGVLETYNIDRDIVLAGALCILVYPWISRILGDDK